MQTRKGDLDKGQVRGEEVPEEAGFHRDPHQRGEEVGAAVEREEVSEASQRQHRPQNAAKILSRAWQNFPFHPLCRCVQWSFC